MENNILSISEIEKVAAMVATSNFLGTNKVNDVFTLLMLARSQGTDILQAAMDYDIIQGKVSIKTRAAQSRFQKSGGKINFIVSDDKICEAEFSHPQGSSIKIIWTLERAAKIKVNGVPLTEKQNWKNYPAQMLRARCIAEGIRACAPFCLDNLYLSEEVQDFDKPLNYKIKENLIIDSEQILKNKKYIESTEPDKSFSKIETKKTWKDYSLKELEDKIEELLKNKDKNRDSILAIISYFKKQGLVVFHYEAQLNKELKNILDEEEERACNEEDKKEEVKNGELDLQEPENLDEEDYIDFGIEAEDKGSDFKDEDIDF